MEEINYINFKLISEDPVLIAKAEELDHLYREEKQPVNMVRFRLERVGSRFCQSEQPYVMYLFATVLGSAYYQYTICNEIMNVLINV